MILHVLGDRVRAEHAESGEVGGGQDQDGGQERPGDPLQHPQGQQSCFRKYHFLNKEKSFI